VVKWHIYPEKFKSSFETAIFQKIIDDAQTAGLIFDNEDGDYKSTAQVYRFYNILVPMGKLTGSMKMYNQVLAESEYSA
jgi:hypothetical protein